MKTRTNFSPPPPFRLINWVTPVASVRLAGPWELILFLFRSHFAQNPAIFVRHLFTNPLRYCQAIGQIWSSGQVRTYAGPFGPFPVYLLHFGSMSVRIRENVPATKSLVSGIKLSPK